MTDVFVIRNQLGHYWGKGKAWVDGAEPRAVMRAKHEDEAINTLVELSARDFELRGEVLATPLNERGQPDIEPSLVPLLSDPESEQDGGTQPESGSETSPPAEVLHQ